MDHAIFYEDEVDIYSSQSKIGADWQLRGQQKRVVSPTTYTEMGMMKVSNQTAIVCSPSLVPQISSSKSVLLPARLAYTRQSGVSMHSDIIPVA